MTVIMPDRLLDQSQGQIKNYKQWSTFFLDPHVCDHKKEKQAVHFLNKQFQQMELDKISFPSGVDEIPAWCRTENRKAGQHYQDYLNRRRLGSGREYFQTIGHAFEFLVKIAPVKKVDGAWLYSLLHYWKEPIFHELILIYLEELGLGLASSNHVCIYNDLLRVLQLEDFESFVEDDYYHHPAIQLALAYAPAEFIPEIIGFNLGYEQLPLHLLVTNYELAELGIDSKYFNLHITIDNLDSGHAHKSLNVIGDFAQKYKNKAEFLQKLKRGYALNNTGMTSSKIIANLNLSQWVEKIFQKKALVGQLVHNDRCQFSGKTIHQWLAQPEDVAAFLAYLVEQRWIKLNADPEESLFWRMLHHQDGKMYGVFSLSERQMIHDWIVGDQSATQFIAYEAMARADPATSRDRGDYFIDDELDALQQSIAQVSRPADQIDTLIPFLAPSLHHQKVGLWSTQTCVEFLFPYLVHHPIALKISRQTMDITKRSYYER